MAFEKLTSACFFQISREIMLLYLLIVCMKEFGQCIYDVLVCCAPSTPRNFGVFKNTFVVSLILEKVNL